VEKSFVVLKMLDWSRFWGALEPTSGARGYYNRPMKVDSSFTKHQIDFWRFRMDERKRSSLSEDLDTDGHQSAPTVVSFKRNSYF